MTRIATAQLQRSAKTIQKLEKQWPFSDKFREKSRYCTREYVQEPPDKQGCCRAERRFTSGELVSLKTTVGHANQLFGTTFETFEHPSVTKPLVRSLSVFLPPELVGHVDVVHATTSFAIHSNRLTLVVRRAAEKPAVSSCCNSTIIPARLQELYGIPRTPAKNSTLLITGYGGELAEKADLFLCDSSRL